MRTDSYVTGVNINSLTMESGGIRYLIDTRAAVSCLLIEMFQPTSHYTLKLSADNNLHIRCRGKKEMIIEINGKTLKLVFHVCDVSQSIIGDDFLSHFKFHINYENSNVKQMKISSMNQ